MTETDPDAELRAMAQHLFGDDRQEPDVDVSQPKPKGTNFVPAEGNNPGPHPISDEAVTRDWVRRMFDADYAAYQQHPDGAAPPYPI